MVVFEVVQAFVHNWVIDEKRSRRKNAIYMEIYIFQVQKSCQCYGQKEKKSSKTQAKMRCSTGIVEEAQELQFRKYTDDGILSPLAILGNSKLRARRGDEIHLCADIFRIQSERGTCDEVQMDASEAKKVCTLIGTFKVGLWDSVYLYPPGGSSSASSSDDLEASGLHAVMALRPVSSRPFLLEYAKPVEKDSSIEAYYHQAQLAMTNSRASRAGSQESSRQTQRRGSHSGKQSLMVPTFDAPQNEKQRKRDTFKLTSFLSAESRRWNSEAARTRFMDWRPGADSEWQKLWANIWPEKGDNLYGKTEVVPLMETEFRRDCIVFFNTIFPRSGKKSFSLLRDTVLELTSKAAFKTLPAKMEPVGEPIAETNAGSLREVLWSIDADKEKPHVDYFNSSENPTVQHHLSDGTLASGAEEEEAAPLIVEDNSPPIAKALSDSLMELYGGYGGAALKEERSPLPSTALTTLSRPQGEDVPLNVPMSCRRFSRTLSQAIIPKCGDCGIVLPEVIDDDYDALGDPFSRLFDDDSEDEAYVLVATSEHLRTKPPLTREVHMCLKEPYVGDSAACLSRTASPDSSPLHTSPSHSHTLGVVQREYNFVSESSDSGTGQLPRKILPRSPTTSASGSRSLDPNYYRRKDEAPDDHQDRVFASISSKKPMGVVPEMPEETHSTKVFDKSPSAKSFTKSINSSRSNFFGPSNSYPMSAVTSISKASFSAARGTGTGKRTGGIRCITSKHGCDFVDEYSPRISLLKRLFVCFAHCGVHYSEVTESSQIGDPWPYPLASVLGHGCRILIRLEDVEGSEFMNFLLTGDPSAMDWKVTGVPPPLKPRIAATHSVSIEAETGRIFERKLHVTSAADGVQNFRDGLKKKHLGLDMPIGGVGNPSPLGRNYSIGFRGDAYQVEKLGRGNAMLPRSNSWSLISLAKPNSPATTDGEALTCRPVPDVQGGHLYVRIDDFGDHIGSSSWAENDKSVNIKQDMRTFLREKPAKAELPVTMMEMVRRVASRMNAAGELLLPTKAEYACKRKYKHRPSTHGRHAAGDMTMMRVSSEPTIVEDSIIASREDNAWLQYVILAKSNEKEQLQSPPSSTALRLLFDHYYPLHAEIYGNPPFKSFQDLFVELKEEKSFIVKSTSGIQRCVEPTIVQLCWRHLVLILRFEVPPRKDAGKDAVEKNTFIATRTAKDEAWYEATVRAVSAELNISMDDEVLQGFNGDDDKCLSTMKETTVSPSYPGLKCLYNTHMVRFQIQDSDEDAWRRLGILDAEKSGAALRLNCDFMTVKDTPAGQKQLYWQWVPRTEAEGMQKFLNMGEATVDERWARYAYQTNGMVRYPPSAEALAILLRRCGIDISKFGTGTYKPLRDFWLELTNEESFLQMSNCKPVRVAEATFVRLQWRQSSENGTDATGEKEKKEKPKTYVLVQVREERPDGKVTERKKLLSTRKGKEETWEDSAIRCIVQDLCITKQQLKSHLARKTSSLAGYLFFEEWLKESISYPGIQGSYRTHLVTVMLKTCFGASVVSGATKRFESNLRRSGSSHSLSPGYARTPSSGALPSVSSAGVTRADAKVVKTRREIQEKGVKTMDFEWIAEDQLQSVKGVDLWAKANARRDRRRISSVLMGLEGSGPGMKSPFGGTHDASGKSKPTSAVGNHKWKAFRLNNALQVPSDENGMRMRITREMFKELQETCRRIEILDPGLDLLAQSGQTRDRSYLDHAFAEREFFKHILSSSSLHAKEVLRWYLEYRETHPTLAQRAARVCEHAHSASF